MTVTTVTATERIVRKQGHWSRPPLSVDIEGNKDDDDDDDDGNDRENNHDNDQDDKKDNCENEGNIDDVFHKDDEIPSVPR